jgi:glycosyltransferase involved in cell wall biosynthesis
MCCHNSADKIYPALRHLQQQALSCEIPWEVIVVNNASKDSTVDAVRSLWQAAPVTELRMLNEERPGLAFARVTGLNAAKYEFVTFVDDDNWIAEDWVSRLFGIMEADPLIGACGGMISAVFEAEAPAWFDTFERSFAVGEQYDKSGEITENPGVLFGAGLSLRKPAWDHLQENGFTFRSTGRQGGRLLCGEDYELCLAIKLSGWKLWYDPALKLKHFMPASRMEWSYLRNLLRGVGESDTNLLPYYFAINGNFDPPNFLWVRLLLRSLIFMISKTPLLLQFWFRSFEGDSEVLRIERSIGYMKSVLRENSDIERRIREIGATSWITR